eukprot:scaffold3256_cov444-Prasinococcus_capsulatus_cf.AAC.2
MTLTAYEFNFPALITLGQVRAPLLRRARTLLLSFGAVLQIITTATILGFLRLSGNIGFFSGSEPHAENYVFVPLRKLRSTASMSIAYASVRSNAPNGSLGGQETSPQDTDLHTSRVLALGRERPHVLDATPHKSSADHGTRAGHRQESLFLERALRRQPCGRRGAHRLHVGHCLLRVWLQRRHAVQRGHVSILAGHKADTQLHWVKQLRLDVVQRPSLRPMLVRVRHPQWRGFRSAEVREAAALGLRPGAGDVVHLRIHPKLLAVPEYHHQFPPDTSCVWKHQGRLHHHNWLRRRWECQVPAERAGRVRFGFGLHPVCLSQLPGLETPLYA